jgi:hypothetical protein
VAWYTLTLITQVWGWLATLFLYIYIYVGGCSNRSTERGARLVEAGVARCCSPHAPSSTVGYAKLITTDSSRFHKLLGRHCLSPVHGTEMVFLFFFKYCVFFRGPGWFSRYNDSLLASRPGVRIQVQFSAPIQTDPGAHPASSTRGLFPGDKEAGAWGWPHAPI